MTAATLTRTTRRSAFPSAVEELIPLARDYAAELGTTPSRNQLMKRFKVGDKKAKALLAALAADVPAEQGTERLRELGEIARAADNSALTLNGLADMDELARAAGIDWKPEVLRDFAIELKDRHAIAEEAQAEPTLDTEPVEAPKPAAVVAEPVIEPGDEPTADTPPAGRPRVSRYGMATLLTVVGVLLAGVIVAPIALSSQDIIAWAASPIGLGLTGPWPLVTFFALDAAAAVCVGLVVYCAWRGESAGVFAWLVWAFAGMSAYANYSHSSGSAARDAVWFFPAMSLAGPFLLEIIVRRVRRWVQEGTGQLARHHVSFGLGRWIPGVGATRETYGAWRLARLDGIDDADQAVAAYRQLCPDGSIRVLSALRKRDQH